MFCKLLNLISAEGMLQILFMLEGMNHDVAIHKCWVFDQTLRAFSAIGTSIGVMVALSVLLPH